MKKIKWSALLFIAMNDSSSASQTGSQTTFKEARKILNQIVILLTFSFGGLLF